MSPAVSARAGQVLFILWSDRGYLTLTVHDPTGQTVHLPLAPSNAVPDALPLLDPVYGHYIAQWEKLLVPGGDLPRAFWVEASALPDRVVSHRDAGRLSAIVRRHAPPPATAGAPWTPATGPAESVDDAGIRRYRWE